MAGDFSHPRAVMPGVKIPEVVDIAKADLERQKTYSGLADVRNAELAGKLDLDGPLPAGETAKQSYTTQETDQPLSLPTPVVPEVDEEKWTPTIDDKKEFVRAVLALKPFEKTVEIFGQVKVHLQDRTFDETENLYEQIATDSNGVIATNTDEAYAVWESRYKLAATLRKVTVGRKEIVFDKAAPAQGDERPEGIKLGARFAEIKEKLGNAAGLLGAVVDASACFEAIVFKLTNAAQNKDFWKTAGANSPSQRT